jgi:hypothetical protein
MVDDILVTWAIHTFDRQLKGPSTPPIKHYVLDWTKTSKDEQAEIMNILGIFDGPDEQKPMRLGTKSETLSVGPHRPDKRILRFRQMFVKKSVEEPKRPTSDVGKTFRPLHFCLPDYFEDETGREISMQERMQIATGDKNAIFFDAENMVKIGPCPICAREKWTVDKANTLFNFMQVVGLIWRSSWARKKTSITTNFDNEGKTNITCDFPAVESMCAVLTLFRQLYAKDILMKSTCDIYMEHSSNAIKKLWVDYCLKNFEQSLNWNTHLIHLQGCTVTQLFDAFLYGTGIVHSPNGKDNRNCDHRNRISELVKQYGREKVIMAVNESFWMVFGYAVDVFHVVKQDYEHWIGQEGCRKSDMSDIDSLLRSHVPQ